MQFSTKRVTEGLLAASFLALSVGGVQAVTITGTSIVPGSFPGYGTTSANHNVINSGTSGVTDTNSPLGTTLIGGGSVSTNYAQYNVVWYYVGSESGDINRFSANGVGGYDENNANNNCAACGSSPTQAPQLMGTSLNQTGPLDFTLRDTGTGNQVTNLTNGAPGTGVASLVFSYLVQTSATTWSLTSAASDWFLFGFNDNGGADDNHDDFVGVAHVSAVPLPAALPLFGAGLGLLGLLGRRRRKPMDQLAA